jgi:hypothetical protein
MRLTKRFERWLSENLSSKWATAIQEYECEICGAEPMADRATFICSIVHPEHEGWGEYWQKRYDVCLDCLKAGAASFPDRLRKHAQELEERARELRQLANAEFCGSTCADLMREQEERQERVERQGDCLNDLPF